MDDKEFIQKLNRGMKIKAMAEAGLLPESLLNLLPEDLREELKR